MGHFGAHSPTRSSLQGWETANSALGKILYLKKKQKNSAKTYILVRGTNLEVAAVDSRFVLGFSVRRFCSKYTAREIDFFLANDRASLSLCKLSSEIAEGLSGCQHNSFTLYGGKYLAFKEGSLEVKRPDSFAFRHMLEFSVTPE
jgi:hypothetical protein